MKTALIVGSNGQDGTILYEYLLRKKYAVIGLDVEQIKSTNIDWKSHIDIKKYDSVHSLLETIKPDEVYYLAAYHHSSEDRPVENSELFRKSYDIHVLALIHFLEAIKKVSPTTRLFYAASSLLFGEPASEVQDEYTPFNPDTIYGITKLDGLHICRYYRKKYNIFASAGILYNHESTYRKRTFLSKKIIRAAIEIKNKKRKILELGDLSAEIDWGYAPDYVDAMYRILHHERADDFIIATGTKHSVVDFVDITFTHLGLNWKHFVRENKDILTRKRKTLVGNAKKLQLLTGWKPSIDFEQMVLKILDEEKLKLETEYS